jgi:toxin ParE1/3/4
MRDYKLTPKAARDIFDIWLWIAQDSVESADRVEAAIFKNCQILAEMPLAGHLRPDLTKKAVLLWPASPYDRYAIVYDPRSKPLRILRVVHTAGRRVWSRGI